MGIPEVLVIFALILAVIDQARFRGESLTAWAVILIAAALLYGEVVV